MDSLVNYLTAWEALPASRWALGTIRSGFMLLWGPRRLSLVFSSHFHPPGSDVRAAVFREEVAVLVRKVQSK